MKNASATAMGALAV